MPRSVPQETIREWRRLHAMGKSYRWIAQETKWDARTVSTYLQKEIQAVGIEEIRRELFKDRLGRHWDDLIKEVSEPLRLIKEIDPWEHLERLAEKKPGTFEIAGATVSIGADWKPQVAVTARSKRAWILTSDSICQPIPCGALWSAGNKRSERTSPLGGECTWMPRSF